MYVPYTLPSPAMLAHTDAWKLTVNKINYLHNTAQVQWWSLNVRGSTGAAPRRLPRLISRTPALAPMPQRRPIVMDAPHTQILNGDTTIKLWLNIKCSLHASIP